MRKSWLMAASGAALMLAGTAAVAQPGDEYSGRAFRGPTPYEQNQMHTGSSATNGSSSVALDRDGPHADGFPKIRLADMGSPFHERRHHGWRHRHHASDEG